MIKSKLKIGKREEMDIEHTLHEFQSKR